MKDGWQEVDKPSVRNISRARMSGQILTKFDTTVTALNENSEFDIYKFLTVPNKNTVIVSCKVKQSHYRPLRVPVG
jgi:hypothetical protein